MQQESKLVVLTSVALALLSFITLIVYTPPDLGTRISRDQALAAIEGSPKVDAKIVANSTHTIADLRWMRLDWRNFDWITVSMPYYLFLAADPPNDYEPFWLVQYQNRILVEGDSWDYEGRYIVDALSGELVASVERTYPTQHNSDLSTPIIYFYTISTDPPLPDFDKPFELGAGQTIFIDVIAKAGPAYDASLPLTFEARDIRPGLTVNLNATNPILRTGGLASVRYSVQKSSVSGPNPTPNPNWAFSIEVTGPGGGQGLSVFITP
jgi:hypothetical protein